MSEELIEKIKDKYVKGLKYDEIIKEFNITKSQLIYLIQKNKWKRKSNRSLVMKNNKNAKGNKGGKAPKNNKNAVVTGEYETLFFDVLNDEEKKLYQNLQIVNKKNCVENEYKMLTIREYRILKRIKSLQDKEKDMNIERIVKRQYNSSNSNETETVTEAINIITPLQKLEDSLTRVQESKRKCLDTLHRIETDNRKLELDLVKLEMEAAKEDSANTTEDIKDDSFIKALNESAEGAWEDEDTD